MWDHNDRDDLEAIPTRYDYDLIFKIHIIYILQAIIFPVTLW